ncbi:MAG: hypothetical protein AAF499_11280 [Pseudomonadota bacterium]
MSSAGVNISTVPSDTDLQAHISEPASNKRIAYDAVTGVNSG